jgi:hypothetical protein
MSMQTLVILYLNPVVQFISHVQVVFSPQVS